MAGISERRLKQKSILANQSEYFVFLPNNLTDINAVNANPIFRDAIAAKNAGNASFEDNQFDDAVKHYNRAIDMLEGLEVIIDAKSCALGVCYQNRATANACKKNYADAISDASKAIELNDHYSKAYYRRAMCYYDQKRYYRALQDIMQACVLERFKNRLYVNAAVEIVAEIGEFLLHFRQRSFAQRSVLILTLQTRTQRSSSGRKRTMKWMQHRYSATVA